MYSFLIAEAPASNLAWARYGAMRAINDATDAFEAAAAGLMHLADDTNWQSDGVRALHDKLGDLRASATTEIGAMRAREWELNQVGGR